MMNCIRCNEIFKSKLALSLHSRESCRLRILDKVMGDNQKSIKTQKIVVHQLTTSGLEKFERTELVPKESNLMTKLRELVASNLID